MENASNTFNGPSRFQVLDVVNFIVKNRANKAFKNWKDNELGYRIFKAVKSNEVFISSYEGQIEGVILIERQAFKVIHIVNILCISRRSFADFVNSFNRVFPDWTLAGDRRGRYVRYKDTKRLCHLLQLKLQD